MMQTNGIAAMKNVQLYSSAVLLMYAGVEIDVVSCYVQRYIIVYVIALYFQ